MITRWRTNELHLSQTNIFMLLCEYNGFFLNLKLWRGYNQDISLYFASIKLSVKVK